ncbi:MAG TPA: hypothetical protein VD767_02215 [Thermomicrobiales bacterium]|nr:hypothetical protein [Thermomicrobiales bacterium]
MQDCVNLDVMVPAAVVPGTSGRTFVPEAAAFGESTGRDVIRVNDEPDAVHAPGLEE